MPPPPRATAATVAGQPFAARVLFEDGEMLVLAAGRECRYVATNTMGELLIPSPALSESVMFVRTANSVFAIGRKP